MSVSASAASISNIGSLSCTSVTSSGNISVTNGPTLTTTGISNGEAISCTSVTSSGNISVTNGPTLTTTGISNGEAISCNSVTSSGNISVTGGPSLTTSGITSVEALDMNGPGGNLRIYTTDPNKGIKIFHRNQDGESTTSYQGGIGSWNGIGLQCELDATTRFLFHTRSGIADAPNWNSTSDDRLKKNEEYILDATSTLLKLRPQIYDKKTSMKPDEETTDADYLRDSGLIAQEVYYDAPELRHLIGIPEGATGIEDPPSGYTGVTGPQNDPDYSNWGETSATLSYLGLIAYLIAGFQEQQAEITTLKTQMSDVLARLDALENP